MVLIYLIIFLCCFSKKLRTIPPRTRQFVVLWVLLYLIFMIAYEMYVENKVGWVYGVPLDDDTGWIFKAADAMRQGTSWDQLYLLVNSSDYDLANRALGLGNLGQYLYATWVCSALYYPTFFDIHVNLYLIYSIQIIMVFIMGIDIANYFSSMIGRDDNEVYRLFWPIFIAFVFCPIVQFSAYKLLRETWFVFFMVQALHTLVQYSKVKRKGLFVLSAVYAIGCLLLRPHAVIFLVPVFIYFSISSRIGQIVNLSLLALLSAGSFIIVFAAQVVGWDYHIGSINIGEAIHLLLFPNIINQFNEMIQIGSNPSWVTILYFFQSLWNVIYVSIAIIGVLTAKKRKSGYIFWMVLFLNNLIFYTIPYDIANMTPRYKFLFLIPLIYFIGWGIHFFKFRILIRRK